MSPVEPGNTAARPQRAKRVVGGDITAPSIPVACGIRLFPLSAAEFSRVARLIYKTCGIHLKEGKQDLVKARLGRRLRTLALGSFDEYFDLVENDATGVELAEMVDLLTTNKTEFFRDSAHFEFIRREILPWCSDLERVRFWSAGCSTGQEPYSLAIVVREFSRDLSRRDCRILATDICRPALDRALEGKFAEADTEGLPSEYRSRYFSKADGGGIRVGPALSGLIHFARLNLMEKWPMRGPFQLIMCRNVMIYFDRETREELVDKFSNLLGPGGYLMVGLSESLTGLSHTLRYVQPAVYRKE